MQIKVKQDNSDLDQIRRIMTDDGPLAAKYDSPKISSFLETRSHEEITNTISE